MCLGPCSIVFDVLDGSDFMTLELNQQLADLAESTSYGPENDFDVIDGSKGCKQMATKINTFTPVFF